MNSTTPLPSGMFTGVRNGLIVAPALWHEKTRFINSIASRIGTSSRISRPRRARIDRRLPSGADSPDGAV
jgi:hypothetical protein